MVWTKHLGASVVACLFLFGAARAAHAETTQLRIASFATPGSQEAAALQKTAEELATKTSGAVSVKYIAGASDERDAVRQLKLGQLEGANVTSIGLAAIDQSIRVLELPLLFESTQELDYVADKVWPYFQRKFARAGFELGARGEVGFVYLLTKSELKTFADLEAQKLCLTVGDPLLGAWFKELGVNAVPLALPEISRANQQTFRAARRLSNDDAKSTLRSKGIAPSQMPAATAAALAQRATELWNELAGKLYTKSELKMVLDARAEFRAKHKQ